MLMYRRNRYLDELGMALECLEFLIKEITDMSIEELDEKMLDNLVTWQYNGSKSTIDEFRKLDSDTKQEVIDFIKEFLIYEELSVNNKSSHPRRLRKLFARKGYRRLFTP